MELEADVLPFSKSSEAEILIEIYVVTGFHGFLKIPESFCKECNMFYQAAKQASESSELDVEIAVKSYWTRFLRPLVKGGHHPPVMLVNGELVAQGYDVPDEERILNAIDGTD